MMLKLELFKLICTDDPKYSAVRKKLTTSRDKSETVLVSVIAAAIGRELGIVTAVLVAPAAWALIALVSAGKHAFCELVGRNADLHQRRR
jgi:hypothetical protein